MGEPTVGMQSLAAQEGYTKLSNRRIVVGGAEEAERGATERVADQGFR